MITISPAKNYISEILSALITEPEVFERQFQTNSFRDALSQLRHHYGLPIRHVDLEKTNKFGRKIKVRRHFLLSIHRKKALKIFEKINK